MTTRNEDVHACIKDLVSENGISRHLGPNADYSSNDFVIPTVLGICCIQIPLNFFEIAVHSFETPTSIEICESPLITFD